MEEVCEGKDFSFPKQEEKILQYWSEIKAFETQLALTENLPEYVFYDGPPLATGLPHYGHILAGTIKDIITRYQSMTGHHVTRRFDWDCHDLPVENEIDKNLNITRREQVMEMGIDKYNEECRNIVTRFVEEWENLITRTGRWIDFRNYYKTMDLKFMESVWWVFAQIYNKDLVYKGFKVCFCHFDGIVQLVKIEENLRSISSYGTEMEMDNDAQEEYYGHGTQEMEAIRREITQSLMNARGTRDF